MKTKEFIESEIKAIESVLNYQVEIAQYQSPSGSPQGPRFSELVIRLAVLKWVVSDEVSK